MTRSVKLFTEVNDKTGDFSVIFITDHTRNDRLVVEKEVRDDDRLAPTVVLVGTEADGDHTHEDDCGKEHVDRYDTFHLEHLVMGRHIPVLVMAHRSDVVEVDPCSLAQVLLMVFLEIAPHDLLALGMALERKAY